MGTLSGHRDHVAWLAHQYALDHDDAEEEAQRRYQLMPHEVDRWKVQPEDIRIGPELVDLVTTCSPDHKTLLSSLGFPGYGEQFAKEVLIEAGVLSGGPGRGPFQPYVAPAIKIVRLRWVYQQGS